MKVARKFALATFITIFAVTSFSFLMPKAFAEQSSNISQIMGVRRKTAVVIINADGLKDKMGIINMTIKNESTGKERKRNFRARFNSDGKARVRVRGLKPDTKYSFSVRVKSVGEKFGPFSNSESATTQK